MHVCYDVMTQKLKEKYGFELKKEMIDTTITEDDAEKALKAEIQQRKAKRNMMSICRARIEHDKISDYLHMVLIFTSAARKCPYPLEMLSNVANPYHI